MGSLDNFLCLHCTTEPSQEREPDSEDENVTAISWLLVNAKSNELGSVQYSVVKSSEEILDSTTTSELTEAEQLEQALRQFEDFLEENLANQGEKWCVVTDGDLTLRHYLHCDAIKKKLKLSHNFYTFYDLRREFRRITKNGTEFNSLEDIITYCNIDTNNNSPAGLDYCKLMGSAMQYLIRKGHVFKEPERISAKYEPGPCIGPVLDETVLRARGLPWQASDQDVANFFRGLNIIRVERILLYDGKRRVAGCMTRKACNALTCKRIQHACKTTTLYAKNRGGIAFCLNMQGRRNGEAFIRFESGEHKDLALKRHKMHLGARYIEVYKATAQDFLRIVRGPIDVTQIAANFVSTKAEVIVRMRGLPFSTKPTDVVKFFGDDAPVYRGEAGILMVRGRNGKATGDAFVLFETEEHGRAALKKHREVLGSRYVELFRSSQSEVQQVLSTSSHLMAGMPHLAMLPSPLHQHPPFHPPVFLPPPPAPYTANAGGNAKDCLRLRGLPFSATVQDVLDFMKEHAAYVAPGGVHMVYNTQGRPSGDAYVQLISQEVAQAAASDLHKNHMGERYIEVFPCSNSEIAAVIASSTLNQTKIPPLGNLSYTPPCTYPVTSGIMGYANSNHMNGHTVDSSMVPSPSRSPPTMYVHQQTPYYNCVVPSNGVGCSPLNYYPSNSTGAMRVRMAPYITPAYEMVPVFHHGYQVGEYGVGHCR